MELKGGDNQFAVLVDRRDGDNKGVILQHPLFDKLLAEQGKLPDRFKDDDHRVGPDDLPKKIPAAVVQYGDPLAADEHGAAYDRHWLAYAEPVRVRGRDTGWVVIVQQSYQTVIGSTLGNLKAGLIRRGLTALLLIALVMIMTWWCAARLSTVVTGSSSHREME